MTLSKQLHMMAVTNNKTFCVNTYGYLLSVTFIGEPRLSRATVIGLLNFGLLPYANEI